MKTTALTAMQQLELTPACARMLSVAVAANAVFVVTASTTKIRHDWRSGGLRRKGALH